MSEVKNEAGVIGLSVMGRSLALNLADHGYAAAAYNRGEALRREMRESFPHERLTVYEDLGAFAASLKRPRRILLMVKAGEAVDQLIKGLLPLLERGDILIDGGNSFFEDTIRREAFLRERGIFYFGTGISGGESGARFGPSIMPGGDREAYAHIRGMLEDISAKTEAGRPCCAYMGENGAGHYVKMTHNGVEYADMQIIAEAYLLLRHIGGLSNGEVSAAFGRWNEGELHSFLMGISSLVLKERDPFTGGELIDSILDSAAQKGTGKWTSIEALRQGADCSMITAACGARVLSGFEKRRKRAASLYPFEASASDSTSGSALDSSDLGPDFSECVREALYCAKIIAYSQGFDLLFHASASYGWALPFREIAEIFQAGCIIQARFLKDIARAYERDPALSHLLLDEFFVGRLRAHMASLRRVVALGAKGEIPLPCMGAALSYFEQFRAAHIGANLIQAQRDYFGAHTFRRTDREGDFHQKWGEYHAE